MVKGFRKKEVERLAERDFAAGSNVVSEVLSCWPAVAQAGCQHFLMRPFRKPRRQLAVKSVEPPGRHKTALAGTYSRQRDACAVATSQLRLGFNRRYQFDSVIEILAWAAVHAAQYPDRVIVSEA